MTDGGSKGARPSPGDLGERPAEGMVVGGRYRLVEELGAGGMGAVWSARHTVTHRRVALKFVHAHRAADITVARVVREARAASAVEHVNLCAVHDVIELSSETAVLVMDYLEGQTLRALLRERGKLEIEEAAAFFAPVASALGAAHAAGVLHRDIKPENLFRERDGRARVLDFGIAKLEATQDIDTDSANAGTPPYMAPEQLLGDKRFDARVDVWSLGVVLYESLSGICPTTVGAENAGQVLRNVIERPIAPLASVAPDVPEPVSALVDRMLLRDVDVRCATMEEVLQALRPWSARVVPDVGAPAPPRSEGPTPAADAAGAPTLTSPGARLPAGVGASGAEAERVETGPRPSGAKASRSTAGRLLAVAVVSAAAGLTWLGLRPEPEVSSFHPETRATAGPAPPAAPPASAAVAQAVNAPGEASGALREPDVVPHPRASAATSAPPRPSASVPRGGLPSPASPATSPPSASPSQRPAAGPLDEPW